MKILRILALVLFLWAPLEAQEAERSRCLDDASPRWLLTGYIGSFGIADDELDEVGMTTEPPRSSAPASVTDSSRTGRSRPATGMPRSTGPPRVSET